MNAKLIRHRIIALLLALFASGVAAAEPSASMEQLVSAEQPAAPTERPAALPEPPPSTEGEHYTLRRDVLKLELTGTAPAARIQCTVQRQGTPSEETAVWDPEERRGGVRYLLLRKQQGSADARYSLYCSSDNLEERVTEPSGANTSRIFRYAFEPVSCKTRQVGAQLFASAQEPLCAQGALRPIAGGEQRGSELKVELSVLNDDTSEAKLVLRQRYDAVSTTRLRSLDPVTPFIADALTALASVAIERAEEAGKSYARELLQKTLCERLTVKKIQGMKGSALAGALEPLSKGLSSDQPLLGNTCKVIRSVRIDELASSSDALWKALAADAVMLALDIVEWALTRLNHDGAQRCDTHGVSSVSNVIGYARKSALDALSGNTATTERDVQMLLLELGRIGSCGNTRGWRCGLEVGFAVLHECMRVSECSADALGRLLAEEREAWHGDSKSPGCNADQAIGEWPELPGLLGRAVDVFRPPPGTPAKTTAVTALQLVLDVLDHALASGEPREEESTLLERVAADVKKWDLEQSERCFPLASADWNPQHSWYEQSPCSKTGLSENLTAIPEECRNFTHALKDLKNLPDTSGSPILIRQALNSLRMTEEARQCSKRLWPTSGSGGSDLEKLAELADKREQRSNARFARAMIGSLRAFLDMLVREDGTMAVAEVGSTLSGAVAEYCAAREEVDGRGKCSVAVRSKDIERAFRVVGALVSYSTSYRTASGPDDADPAKLAELRADQRKKAMESLIDAMTDRVNRGGDWIASLGASVGFAASLNGVRRGNGADGDGTGPAFNVLPLRLATGLSLQEVPDGWGWHFQLTLADIAQFAATRWEQSSIEGAEPDVRSAILFGADVGIVLGKPSFPFVLAAFGGYAPWLRFDEERVRGAYVFGGTAGIYVPFIDFN